MSSRSAVVLVVLFVAIIAFCFAGVFAAMTGTYHLNFGNNDTNQTPFFGNMTNPDSDSSHSSSGGSVQTYTDSGNSHSNDIETKEDTSSNTNNPGSDQSNPPAQDSGSVPQGQTNKTAKKV